MALQALALRGAPPIESEPEQALPELPRPRKVIGRKLDQIDRHHPFSLCRLAPVRRYRRTLTTAAEIPTPRFGDTEFRPGQQQTWPRAAPPCARASALAREGHPLPRDRVGGSRIRGPLRGQVGEVAEGCEP